MDIMKYYNYKLFNISITNKKNKPSHLKLVGIFVALILLLLLEDNDAEFKSYKIIIIDYILKINFDI